MSEAFIIALMSFAEKFGPIAAQGIQKIFTKEKPTQQEWDDNVWNPAKVEWVDAQPGEIVVTTTTISP